MFSYSLINGFCHPSLFPQRFTATTTAMITCCNMLIKCQEHIHTMIVILLCNNTGEDRARRWLPWRDCYLRQWHNALKLNMTKIQRLRFKWRCTAWCLFTVCQCAMQLHECVHKQIKRVLFRSVFGLFACCMVCICSELQYKFA